MTAVKYDTLFEHKIEAASKLLQTKLGLFQDESIKAARLVLMENMRIEGIREELERKQ